MSLCKKWFLCFDSGHQMFLFECIPDGLCADSSVGDGVELALQLGSCINLSSSDKAYHMAFVIR